MLITFSGLDGSGKSTLIQGLKSALEERGFQVRILAMYDHVGVYAFIRWVRGWVKQRLLGAKARPAAVMATDPHRVGVPHVRAGLLGRILYAIVRSDGMKRLVYCLDLVLFVLHYLYLTRLRGCVVVMDRYFYDFLVDVADGRRWTYTRLFLLAAPAPAVPVLVDVSPEVAFARKGEYTVEYMIRRRAHYQRVFTWVRHPLILHNENLDETRHTLHDVVWSRLAGGRP